MKKKAYENLEISIEMFGVKDVIVASGTGEQEPVIMFNLGDNEMSMLR